MSILKNEAVIGHYQQRGGEFRRDNYFPPIVPSAVFNDVQRQIASRATSGGPKGEAVGNLFSGLLHCSACGSVARMVNSNPRFRYVRCRMAYGGKDCTAVAHPYNELEDALLDVVLLMEHTPIEPLVSVEPDKALELRERIASNSRALERLLKVLEDGKDFAGSSATMLKRMADLETTVAEDKKELAKVPPARPLKDAIDTAYALYERHKNATGEELRDIRMRLAAVLRQLFTNIKLVPARIEVERGEVSEDADGNEVVLKPYTEHYAQVVVYGPLANQMKGAPHILGPRYDVTSDGGVLVPYRLAEEAVKRSNIKRRS